MNEKPNEAPQRSPRLITLTPDAYLGQLADAKTQLFDMERRLRDMGAKDLCQRNLRRLNATVDSLARLLTDDPSVEVLAEDPTGEAYNETRTDCEASITGDQTTNLVITEVIRPIVRYRAGGRTTIIQRAVVIVEGLPDMNSPSSTP